MNETSTMLTPEQTLKRWLRECVPAPTPQPANTCGTAERLAGLRHCGRGVSRGGWSVMNRRRFDGLIDLWWHVGYEAGMRDAGH